MGTVPEALSTDALEAIDDPAQLLARAWALEPPLRLAERTAALDRLERLLASGTAPQPPAGRSWARELAAERAIDAARMLGFEQATELADGVLAAAGPDEEIATVRALMARGRAFGWLGTEAATRRADRVLAEVAERCRAMGHSDWEGHAIFWRGQSVYFQNGELVRARELMAEALEVLEPESTLRATILGFYADTLACLGELDAADACLAQAAQLAERDEDDKTCAYTAWGQARIAAHRGDAPTTERLLREVERDSGGWLRTHIGATFLADGAELLDRLGLVDQAADFLRRAQELDPDDEFVRQAEATLLARSGDPVAGIEALHRLVAGEWLEKRLRWRHTLLTAWATFRAGRDGAGALAARALEQVVAGGGGLVVARTTERELLGALLPLAEAAGSPFAAELLLDGRRVLVRLFGATRVTDADGVELDLPAGKPGELVRMLALHEHGLAVEVVLAAFFPEAPPEAARQRLRQILTRLRAAVGELVVRDGDALRLVPAWVDVREFAAAADRVRTARGPAAIRAAYAALALRSGPLLGGDRYADWAQEAIDDADYRHLAMLDLVGADAAARGAHEEALTALDAARAEDPGDARRYSAIADQLIALGRHATAQYLAGRAGVDLDDPAPPGH